MRRFLPLVLLPVALAAAPARAQEGNARALEIAKTSPRARAAYAFLTAHARSIRDPKLRAFVVDMLERPAPTFMERLTDPKDREAMRDALVAAKLLEPDVTPEALFPPLEDPAKAPQSFLGAPGGVPGMHHDFPGGLAEHTAFNLRVALALEAAYRAAYGLDGLDHDLVVAGPILHDAMKAWALQWRADGTLTRQAMIAGTSSHHTFVLAEAVHRGMSPDAVVAVAFAHDPPNDVVRLGFVQAACILAGVNGEAAGYLVRAGGALALPGLPPIEASIDNLSDHDYALLDPAARAVAPVLRDVRARHRGATVVAAAMRGDAQETRWDAADQWWLLDVEARIPQLALYERLRAGGVEAVERALRKAHLLDPAPGCCRP